MGTMIKHVWTVICSRAVIDQDSNNVSLQNVLERVTIPGKPKPKALLPLHFEVVTLWERVDPGVPTQSRMRLRVVTPSGKAFGEMEMRINLLEAERHRNRMRFEGIPVEEAGRLAFNVDLRDDENEWRQVASPTLTIAFQPPEEESETAAE